MDFAVSVDNWVKMNESEMIEKYLDLAREMKRLWNIKVTEMIIVVWAFGTVLKSLEKRGEELRPEEISKLQTTAYQL